MELTHGEAAMHGGAGLLPPERDDAHGSLYYAARKR